MRDTPERRLKLARGGVVLFVLTLGWAAWQNAGLAPVSAETPPPALVIPSNASSSSTLPLTANSVSTHAPIRIEWLNACDPARDDLGLYATDDLACAPGRAATLAWLQSQLTMMRVLSEGEYLQRATHPDQPACGALILNAEAHVGWMCLDAQGVYRADKLGQDFGPRWQLLAEGGWLFVQ